MDWGTVLGFGLKIMMITVDDSPKFCHIHWLQGEVVVAESDYIYGTYTTADRLAKQGQATNRAVTDYDIECVDADYMS